MSTVEISLRLSGTLPPLEQLTQAIGVAPTQSLRRGEQVSKRRVQPVDLWRLDLAKFDSDLLPDEIEQALIHSTQVLQEIAPGIARLDRSECQVDLYISTVRDEDQGGLFLTSEFVTAAAKVGATVQISILVMLDEPDDLAIASREIAVQDQIVNGILEESIKDQQKQDKQKAF